MKILIASSSRADYDLLYPIVLELKKVKKLRYDFLITGSHFSKELSIKIKKNKEKGLSKKYLNILSTNKTNTTLIFANAMKKFSSYLDKNRPDILMVLGDRFEILSLVICATLKKFQSHIFQEENSPKQVWMTLRHSITKFSHYHFVANNIYKKRLFNLAKILNKFILRVVQVLII